MKNIFIVLMVASVGLGACREKKTETTEIIREVKVESPVPEEREGILERTAKEVDKEVNKEINEEIQKIGDDN